MAGHEGQEQGGIDSSGQEEAHGHVAQQLPGGGLFQALAELFGVEGVGGAFRG